MHWSFGGDTVDLLLLGRCACAPLTCRLANGMQVCSLVEASRQHCSQVHQRDISGQGHNAYPIKDRDIAPIAFNNMQVQKA